jgi:hypothetical protein
MTDGAKHLSHTAGSKRWHEVEDDDGTILYVSYHPRFILRYYPWLNPQKILYREWEEEITFTGDDLTATFQNLKAAKPATIKRGLQPDGSTILSIKSLGRP